MSYKLNLNELPIGKFEPIWWWLYQQNIGDMRKQAEDTEGYVEEVTLSDEEITLFTLRWL